MGRGGGLQATGRSFCVGRTREGRSGGRGEGFVHSQGNGGKGGVATDEASAALSGRHGRVGRLERREAGREAGVRSECANPSNSSRKRGEAQSLIGGSREEAGGGGQTALLPTAPSIKHQPQTPLSHSQMFDVNVFRDGDVLVTQKTAICC